MEKYINYQLTKLNDVASKYYHSHCDWQTNIGKCCLCNVSTTCFYKKDVPNHFPVFYHSIYNPIYDNNYVCKIAYKQITELYKHMLLIQQLVKHLDIDIVNIIIYLVVYVKYTNVRCIKIKHDIIKYRKWYLSENFNHYTIKKLDTLFDEHNIRKPKNRRKAEYLNMLNADIQQKKIKWYKEQDNYPIR